MSQTSDFYNELLDCKRNKVFELQEHGKVSNPLIVYDADGTILDLIEGTHWMAAINLLDEEARARIQSRIEILTDSSDTFFQQYLSASSIHELLAAGIDLDEAARKTNVREGVIELMRDLKKTGTEQLVVSHGFTDILTKVLSVREIDFIKVYSNIFPASVELDKNFIPPYESLEKMKNPGEYFQKIVKNMEVVPNTKGNFLEKLRKGGQTIISIGDSIGDIDMFRDTQKLGGISILHTHYDKGQFSLSQKHFEELQTYLSYICVNPANQSFEPTKSFIEKLTF